MKKLFILLLSLMAIQIAVLASNDKPISADQLPTKAKQFLKTHFTGAEISYVKMDTDLSDKSYDVVLANGTKIEFDKKGEWKEVDCSNSKVPNTVVPDVIAKIVSNKHRGVEIRKIERDRNGYEVKLDNGMELKFNSKLKFIRYDN